MRTLIAETDKVMRNIPIDYRYDDYEGDERRQNM